MSTRGLRGEVPAASEDGMPRLGAYHLPVLGRAGGGGRERRLWPWTPPRGCCTHMLLTSAFCSFSLGRREREPRRRTLRQGNNLGQELWTPGSQVPQAIFKNRNKQNNWVNSGGRPWIPSYSGSQGRRKIVFKKRRDDRWAQQPVESPGFFCCSIWGK